MKETQEAWVLSLGQEDPLEEGMAAHPSILAWEPHGQKSQAGHTPWGSQRAEPDRASACTCIEDTAQKQKKRGNGALMT